MPLKIGWMVTWVSPKGDNLLGELLGYKDAEEVMAVVRVAGGIVFVASENLCHVIIDSGK